MSVLRLRSVITLPPIPNVGSRSPPSVWAAHVRPAGPDVLVTDGLTWYRVGWRGCCGRSGLTRCTRRRPA